MKLIFHWFLLIGGIIFVIIGILGLFLPIIPGLLLIILGLIILGGKSKINTWIIKKFPEPVRKYFQVAEKLNPLSIVFLILCLFFLGFLFYYFLQFKY